MGVKFVSLFDRSATSYVKYLSIYMNFWCEIWHQSWWVMYYWNNL